MNKIDPKLLKAAQARLPDLGEEDIVAGFAANLSPLEAQTREPYWIFGTKQTLYVFQDRRLVQEVPLESIAHFAITPGVGCFFAEYERREDGARVMLARADQLCQNAAARAVKCLNHFLRYGDTDFSRMPQVAGSACPKCGRPYPRASHTCPRCVSKTHALRQLFGVAKDEWPRLLATVLLFFVGTGVSILTPYINRVMVDDYIQREGVLVDNAFLWGFAAVVLSLLGAQVLRRAISMARGYFTAIAGNNLTIRLRDMVFRKIQELSIAKLAGRTSGELMKRVNTDTKVIKQFLVGQLPNILEQGLLLLAIAVILFFYDWRMALLILVPMPIVAVLFRLFWRFMRGMFHRRWQLNAESGAILHDIFSGIRVVKSYGMEKREEERFVGMAAKERESQLRVERFWAVLFPLLNFLMGLGEYVLLYYVGSQMLEGRMTAGEMSQFSSYAGMIFGPLMALMNFPRQLINAMTHLTRVCEIMDETSEARVGNEVPMPRIEGYIDIDRVSFGYADAEEVLTGIDLHIKPGEFIGLVGKSGVGKSTLINLIMRMYDVDEGEIRIDGVDIRRIPQEQLRAQMGVVLQENFLFTGSVWQNLTYAKPDATREEVIRAAKAARAHEFIIRLPDGYNTYVGERGHTLSGGERQRISIARALLHDPKILILDEATSALDTETEKVIQDALAALSAGRTTIAIAHRLSTLRNATRLVVMDKGGIAEVGTHDELMAKEGIYYGLVMAQREMTKMD